MSLFEQIKRMTIQDIVLLSLDELGYSDKDIANSMGISPTTIHNTKNKFKAVLGATDEPTVPVEYGNHEVNLIVDAFKTNFGTTKTTRYDRFAAKRLADKHTAGAIVSVIIALAASQGDKFAPSVNSVSQLDTKLPQVIRFLKNKTSQGVTIDL